MEFTIIDQDGHECWTAEQCAAHLNIGYKTWTSYTNRGQCPAPIGVFESKNLWSAAEVREWAAARKFARNS